jgi:hypothetical protein
LSFNLNNGRPPKCRRVTSSTANMESNLRMAHTGTAQQHDRNHASLCVWVTSAAVGYIADSVILLNVRYNAVHGLEWQIVACWVE